MNERLKRIYTKSAARLNELIWENGLIRHDGPGHTRGAQAPVTHSGRDSSEKYVLGRATGKISEQEGLIILTALRSLQLTEGIGNPDALPKLDADAQLGAFRWYLEEDRIWDTNAAFFICMPLILHRLRMPEIFSEQETTIIDEMLALAGNWFYHECQNAIYYYSNKILSDGAALSAIAYLSGNEAYHEMAREFFGKWLDYTEKRGWGWGENTSLGYNGVIFPALRVAEDTLRDEGLKARIHAVAEGQKRFFRFYDGHEVVPSIRTYNYEGLSERPDLVYNLAGVPGNGLDITGKATDLFCACCDELYDTDEELLASSTYQPVAVPRQMDTRVFDSVYARSWYGKHGGVGSLNAFPVISGIDRNPTWGLGWQSMPVSFVVYGEQTGYLRFFVDDGEIIRAHPKRNYLSPRLFSETILPRVTTRSAQEGSMVVSIRAIDHVNNRAREVADEYYVNRFRGEVMTLRAGGRAFAALRYENATVIIGALSGIAYGQSRTPAELEIVRGENDLLLIRQILYRGDVQTLMTERLESAWMTVLIDQTMTEQEIADYVEALNISDRSFTDGQEPRDEWALLREIRISNGADTAELDYDPYRFPGGYH